MYFARDPSWNFLHGRHGALSSKKRIPSVVKPEHNGSFIQEYGFALHGSLGSQRALIVSIKLI